MHYAVTQIDASGLRRIGMAWYECRISEWCDEVIGELFSGHQDKGLASIARQMIEKQQHY
jgi:hypothetical protein